MLHPSLPYDFTIWMPPSCKLTTCHVTETVEIKAFLIPQKMSALSREKKKPFSSGLFPKTRIDPRALLNASVAHWLKTGV